MKAVRVALGAVGLGSLVWGLVLLVGLGPRLPAVLVWAVGGILLHDAVLAPLVVLLGALAGSRVPAWLRAPLVGLLVVLGPLTLVAVPVLGRFGARYDNSTLLDRPYWTGYLALVALAVVVTAVLAERRRRDAPARP